MTLDDLLQNRWFVRGVYGVIGLFFTALILIRMGVYFMTWGDRALDFLGVSPARAGMVERQATLSELLERAEQEVPPPPGAVRLHERRAVNLIGTGPAYDVCWQTEAPLASVIAHYRQAFPAAGWRLRGPASSDRLLGAERGQVLILIHGAADGAVYSLTCPAEATFAVSLTATNAPRVAG